MLAYPAFNHGCNDLHRSLYINSSIRASNGSDFLGKLRAKAIVRKPDDSRAVNGAFDLPRQPGEQRICLGEATEESHVHATSEILVDKHPDVNSLLK